MRVAVVGLGGVGGYICAMLNKGGVDTVGFARGTHLKKIQKDGIKIIEDTHEWVADVEAMELDKAEGYFDIVLFCTKSYDIEDTYGKIAPHTDKDTILMSFSNGVENGTLLRKLSNSIVLDGCVYILSHIKEAGIIRKKGKVFAAVFGGDDKKVINSLERIFEKGSLRIKISDDIKKQIWKKYIFICAFATLTSYYDNSIGYIYKYHKDEAKQLLCEIASVAKAKKIDIDQEIEKSLDTASKIPYDSSTSMWLDFKNNRKTEIETISGYIVKEGSACGVDVNLMNKMYTKLRSASC